MLTAPGLVGGTGWAIEGGHDDWSMPICSLAVLMFADAAPGQTGAPALSPLRFPQTEPQ